MDILFLINAEIILYLNSHDIISTPSYYFLLILSNMFEVIKVKKIGIFMKFYGNFVRLHVKNIVGTQENLILSTKVRSDQLLQNLC